MGQLIKLGVRTKNCRHKNVELDLDLRHVICQTCGANVDPFEWIVSVAIEEDILEARISRLKQELDGLTKRKYNPNKPKQ
ncbi:hypothetical protein Cpin_3829 [Chitinophaga pinensis DSM 2588]|uniref:Uncharacterized protein n=1 Tax=Chitinophaga pinensis (strain ATCC 43595 / DSM 2588 / LMG 13176 / NBRC 15968 / NCIMB 11800 / UQM 2034) TaxID=485918 RepID=A0A979G5Q2_CHIPD|nr:hypothetical protein Cpin_3829 [Chitinophaga pinensis DSM 2588]